MWSSCVEKVAPREPLEGMGRIRDVFLESATAGDQIEGERGAGRHGGGGAPGAG
jgi:hypothetical protein